MFRYRDAKDDHLWSTCLISLFVTMFVGVLQRGGLIEAAGMETTAAALLILCSQLPWLVFAVHMGHHIRVTMREAKVGPGSSSSSASSSASSASLPTKKQDSSLELGPMGLTTVCEIKPASTGTAADPGDGEVKTN